MRDRSDKPSTPGKGIRTILRLVVGMRIIHAQPGPPGIPSRLPSIRALADRFGAHRNTVAAAYADLEALGLVRRVQGSGTYRATHPASRSSGDRLSCADKAFLGMLADDLRSWPVAASGAPGAYVIAPLDRIPPTAGRGLPVAPAARVASHLHAIPAQSLVVVHARSALARRLAGNAVRAIVGAEAGVLGWNPDLACLPEPSRFGRGAVTLLHEAAYPPGDWSASMRRRSQVTACRLRFAGPPCWPGPPREALPTG